MTREQKIHLENFKRIMNRKKSALPSQIKIEWGMVKTETEKINQVLIYLLTNNITELNELIYARAKLVCEKIRIASKSTKKNSKCGWKIEVKKQIKSQGKQAKMIKRRKNAGACRVKKKN